MASASPEEASTTSLPRHPSLLACFAESRIQMAPRCRWASGTSPTRQKSFAASRAERAKPGRVDPILVFKKLRSHLLGLPDEAMHGTKDGR